METEVHEAMVFMETALGKLLNCKQLMRHPSYKGEWQVMSANKFGRPANGVMGTAKETHTIKFIETKDVHKY